MLTLIPARFTAWVTRTASAISVPATKRPETRWPMEERSEKLRKLRFSESWTKKALNMEYLPPPKGIWVASRGIKVRAKIGRPQNFVSQLSRTSCDRAYVGGQGSISAHPSHSQP